MCWINTSPIPPLTIRAGGVGIFQDQNVLLVYFTHEIGIMICKTYNLPFSWLFSTRRRKFLPLRFEIWDLLFMKCCEKAAWDNRWRDNKFYNYKLRWETWRQYSHCTCVESVDSPWHNWWQWVVMWTVLYIFSVTGERKPHSYSAQDYECWRPLKLKRRSIVVSQFTETHLCDLSIKSCPDFFY